MTYPCVLFIREQQASEHHTFFFRRVDSLKDIHDNSLGHFILVDQDNIRNDENCRFLIGTNECYDIVNKIEEIGAPLSSAYNVSRGLPNNKVRFNGYQYDAIKSTNVRKYAISGNLQKINTDYAEDFTDPLLVMPRTVLYLQATIKEKQVVVLDRIYYLKAKDNTPLNTVLGLINSKLINYWFEFNYWTAKVSGGYFDLNGDQIESLPVILPDYSSTLTIEKNVMSILANKKDNPDADTSSLEEVIDNFVYHLYGLTYDEVLIVDPDTPIKREEYEKEM
jgi:hypothetical protein